MQRTRAFDIFGIVKRGHRAEPGAALPLPGAPQSIPERGSERLSVGELMKDGKYLEAMEKALYTKLLDKLDGDKYDECGQVVQLLEGLSII